MVYFFLSTASAYLCWRVLDKENAGGVDGALEDGKGGAGLTNNNNVDGTPGTPVPRALRGLQLVVWNIACVVSLVVVALFWFADVSALQPREDGSA